MKSVPNVGLRDFGLDSANGARALKKTERGVPQALARVAFGRTALRRGEEE